MIQVAVGHSNDPDTSGAADDIIAQCSKSLDGASPQAGLLFAAIDFEHAELLHRLRSRWPGVQLIGCTTDGEMSSLLEFQQDSATLILFVVDADIQIGVGIGTDVSADPAAATRTAIAQATSGLDSAPKLCIALPEALTADSGQILDGLRAALPGGVPIVGGLAADQWRFEATYQFLNDKVVSDAVPVLVMAGAVKCSHGVASGWRPIGKPGVVTRSVGNVVFEIDGSPALDYYRMHLGKHGPSSNFPLAVFAGEDHFYLRAPSGEVNEESGSVSFFADVPEGARVQMSESNRDLILEATQDSMNEALTAYGSGAPAAALFFSCASRRQLLGTRTREEYKLVHDCIANLPCCGFYTNGEISPMSQGEPAFFHNETFISLLIGPETQASG